MRRKLLFLYICDMGRSLLVIIAFVLAAFELSGQNIQGVKWESCGLEQALELASKPVDGRDMVFVDCYSQSCPPCKMMLAKVFPTKEAGDFFNARFVNIKLDLSAPENAPIAEKYDVSSFPTFLILCPDGSELCRVVGAYGTTGASGASVSSEQFIAKFIARVEWALDPANRIDVPLDNFNRTGQPEHLFQYLERLQKEGQFRKLREYVINNYDALSASIVTDLRFWKYIKIAINLQNLSVLEKVLANKASFDQTLGKAKVEKDLYNDLKYELNLYRRKMGNNSSAELPGSNLPGSNLPGSSVPATNIQRAEQVMQMFAPERD